MDNLYNSYEMPLSNNIDTLTAQKKVINGEMLSMKDKLHIGRDAVVRDLDGYELKPYCVYRAISPEMLKVYEESGFVIGASEDDEYQEYEEDGKTFNNNRGVDWYLGGVSLKYGSVVIECPADKEYFVPAFDNGNGMASDPLVKHFKSSGFKHPIPMNMVRVIYPIFTKENNEEKSPKL